MLDGYKALFDLPFDFKPKTAHASKKASSDKANGYLKKHSLNKKKTVLVAPHAKSVDELSWSFWSQLSQSLLDDGWSVILNTDKLSGAHVPHTSLCSDLTPIELAALADKIDWVIALRSGICEILSMTKTKLTILYPAVQWHGGSMLDATGLEAMGLSTDIQEIEIKNPKMVLELVKGNDKGIV